MVTYGYDAWASSKAAGLVRINLEGYKTKSGIKKAMSRKLEREKIVLIGWTLYCYDGGDKYSRNSYRIINHFNNKAFFEYWG